MRLQAARAVEAKGRPSTPRRRKWQSAAIASLAAHRSRRSHPSPRSHRNASPRRGSSRYGPVPIVSEAQAAGWFVDANDPPAPKNRTGFVIDLPQYQPPAVATPAAATPADEDQTSPRRATRWPTALPTGVPPEPTQKSEMPLRLVSSTPAAMRYGGGEGHRIGRPRDKDHFPPITLQASTLSANANGPRRWQQLRTALKGRLRLGRSSERSKRGKEETQHEPLVAKTAGAEWELAD